MCYMWERADPGIAYSSEEVSKSKAWSSLTPITACMKATLSSNNKANQEVFMLFRALLFEEMCGDYAKLQ